MDNRGQILLPLKTDGARTDGLSDLAVEQRGGQLNRVGRQDAGVQAIEPTRADIVPRPGFHDDVIMDAVALGGLKGVGSDLIHTHGA